MDALKREEENGGVCHRNDTGQLISKVCGISKKQIFHISKIKACSNSKLRKKIYLR